MPDAYALPRIKHILDGFAGISYYSVLDMKSGYHQIEIDEEHKNKINDIHSRPYGFVLI